MPDSATRFGDSPVTGRGSLDRDPAGACPELVIIAALGHAPAPLPEPDNEPTPGGGDLPEEWDPENDPADPRKLVPAGV